MNKENITVEDIGGIYTSNGTDVWRCSERTAEPQVMMVSYFDGEIKEGNLSEFKNFVRLLPETKLVPPRKTRKDKGTKKGITPPMTDKPELLKVKTVIGTPDDKINYIFIGEEMGQGTTLRKALSDVLAHYGGIIPDNISEEDKLCLNNILNPLP